MQAFTRFDLLKSKQFQLIKSHKTSALKKQKTKNKERTVPAEDQKNLGAGQ